MNLIYHLETNKFYGWAFKDLKPSVTLSFDNTSYSFIIAVSSTHFYGIMGWEGSTTAPLFIYFLSKVWRWRRVDYDINNNRCWYILDNASIHKTSEVQKFVAKNKICMITIPPYSPSLNAAELFINAIKSKLKQKQLSGR